MQQNYKNMRVLIKIVFLAVVVGFMACSKSDDNKPVDKTKPTATMVSMTEVVDQNTSAPTLNFVIDFADDQGLKEYKVDIHDAFDGHSHGRRDATKAFIFTKVYSMSGKTHKATVSVPIPKDAPTGPYHLVIKYFDAAGNEGQELDLDFEIANEATQPTINILTELNPVKGRSMMVNIAVSDPDGEVEDVVVMVVHEKTGTEIFEGDKHVHAKNAEVTFTIPIPANAPAGTYGFIVAAVDDDGNYTVIEEEFELK